MKVLHICLNGPYTDGLNYQENLLTKFQVKLGYDVYIIASQWKWNEQGKIERDIATKYENNYGVKIYRLLIKGNHNVFYNFKRYENLLESIDEISPDIIFIHNLQFFDLKKIKSYAKKRKVKIYADNHSDFSNSARNFVTKLFYKTVWKHYAKSIEKYVTKFYGVLPIRVDFLKNVYNLSPDKCELLVMGADDELVEKYADNKIKENSRLEFDIKEDDFLIVTGGKIDKFKLQTLLLMQAVKNINNIKVKLLIFGSIDKEIKDKFDNLCDGNTIQYLGWANEEESYKYFSMADLIIFPGRHSVYWEQVVAMGIPIICKYWNGTTHIDIGGNVRFLKEDTIEEIQNELTEILNNKDLYKSMKRNAMKDERKKFLYKNIAIRSIE